MEGWKDGRAEGRNGRYRLGGLQSLAAGEPIKDHNIRRVLLPTEQSVDR